MSVTTTTRSHSITFPNSGSVNWFSTFEAAMQSISDYLDNMDKTAITQIQDAGTSSIITSFNHVASGAYLEFSNNAAGSGVDIDVISSNADESIRITPKSAGDLILDGLKWPQADGAANQYLKTDGSGQLGWGTIIAPGIYNVVEDTSPELGGNLNLGGYDLLDSNGNKTLDIPEIAGIANQCSLKGSSAGNAVEYAAIGSDTNIDVKIAPKGSGQVILGNFTFPTTDGTEDQVLATDGAGNFSFTTLFSDLIAYLVYRTHDSVIVDSLNISSVTDVSISTSTGHIIVNFDSGTFDNTNYLMLGSGQFTDAAFQRTDQISMTVIEYNTSKTTGAVPISITSGSNARLNDSADLVHLYIAFFGGQS